MSITRLPTVGGIMILLAGFILPALADETPVDNTPAGGLERGKVVGGQLSEHPDWFKESFLEIAEDVDEANEAGKHVLLFFHLNGCPYCYKMVEENFKHAPYTDYLQDNFDVIAINIRGDREVVFNAELSLTEKELSRRLDVRYTPTIIFLSTENKPVLRLNGYRSVEDFKHALDFVVAKAYQHTTLQRFIEEQMQEAVYTFREHPNFAAVSDLSTLPDKPLLVLFEDRTCVACDALHDDLLALAETRELLDRFTVVRLDALSEQAIIAPDGTSSTPKDFAAKLDISYRPGIVMFDHGREILRIDGLLYRYHFQELLRYVGTRQYHKYPAFRDYMRVREEEILSRGQNIDLGE